MARESNEQMVLDRFGKQDENLWGKLPQEEYVKGHRDWLSHPVKPAHFVNRNEDAKSFYSLATGLP